MQTRLKFLRCQKLAYQDEARIYDDFNIQPLKQTLEELKEAGKTQTRFKARIDHKIIGSVRAHQKMKRAIMDPKPVAEKA